ncbi:hypothetical protein AMJ80_04100 [bacterium SM23_31]|nr:MAG: hypothetical protein AMJ80_04100 [bacterium SM23_31]
MKSKPLGKGLKALFEESNLSDYIDSGKKFLEIPTDNVYPNPLQPREQIDDEQYESLKQSIRKKGLIQPIAVRQVGNNFEIVAGERRWQAVKELNIPTIPAYLLQIGDKRELLEISMLENLRRVDLNPIEVASGYKRLSSEFGMTQQEISDTFSVDRSTVANFMRLLNLPDDIQKHVKNGDLSMGHARALLALPSEQEQRTLMRLILERNLNVRQTESLIKSPKIKISKSPETLTKKSAVITQLEDRLRYVLGSQVRIKTHKDGGKIEIDYYSNEDLERLIELFTIIEKNIDFQGNNK